MKIGILTFHRAHNYGALLQCYALKTYLSNLGHNVQIIDYWPTYHSREYRLLPNFKSRSLLGKIKAILLLSIGIRRIINRSKRYNKFIYENFNLGRVPVYKNAASIKFCEFDLVVYGSDQIWRNSKLSHYNGFDDVYWGEYPQFVKRKISYAASMGLLDSCSKSKVFYAKKLRNFNDVSVREQALKSLINSICEIPVSVVLDPVFLLEKTEWETLSKKSTIKTTSNKYLFFYFLMTSSKEAINVANEISRRKKLSIIETRGRVNPALIGKRYFQTPSPIDFIQLICNADFIITTSFHGLAFSLLFEKQFYAMGMGENSERAKSLLRLLGLENRYLENCILPKEIESICYDEVTPKLLKAKQNSYEFLKRNLEYE